MRTGIKDEKLILVSSMVVIVVVLSAFGYGWISREESRTGGMGEKWHVAVSDTYQPDLDIIRPDGSMLFTDTEHHLISLVDQNGVAIWTHYYGSELIYRQVVGNDIYLIDVAKNGNYSLECIDLNGVWKSSTPCPAVFGFVPGDDGAIYAYGYENGNSSIYNIEGGSIKWIFTLNGSLGVYKVWNDGNVLLKHIHYDSDYVINSLRIGYDVDEAILISPEGVAQWTVQFPTEHGFYGSSDAHVADNGTISWLTSMMG